MISCDPCYPTLEEVCYCLLLALTTPTLSHPTSPNPPFLIPPPLPEEMNLSDPENFPFPAHNFGGQEEGGELAAWSSLPPEPSNGVWRVGADSQELAAEGSLFSPFLVEKPFYQCRPQHAITVQSGNYRKHHSLYLLSDPGLGPISNTSWLTRFAWCPLSLWIQLKSSLDLCLMQVVQLCGTICKWCGRGIVLDFRFFKVL